MESTIFSPPIRFPLLENMPDIAQPAGILFPPKPSFNIVPILSISQNKKASDPVSGTNSGIHHQTSLSVFSIERTRTKVNMFCKQKYKNLHFWRFKQFVLGIQIAVLHETPESPAF